jgi:hypothetical protein
VSSNTERIWIEETAIIVSQWLVACNWALRTRSVHECNEVRLTMRRDTRWTEVTSYRRQCDESRLSWRALKLIWLLVDDFVSAQVESSESACRGLACSALSETTTRICFTTYLATLSQLKSAFLNPLNTVPFPKKKKFKYPNFLTFSDTIFSPCSNICVNVLFATFFYLRNYRFALNLGLYLRLCKKDTEIKMQVFKLYLHIPPPPPNKASLTFL